MASGKQQIAKNEALKRADIERQEKKIATLEKTMAKNDDFEVHIELDKNLEKEKAYLESLKGTPVSKATTGTVLRKGTKSGSPQQRSDGPALAGVSSSWSKPVVKKLESSQTSTVITPTDPEHVARMEGYGKEQKAEYDLQRGKVNAVYEGLEESAKTWENMFKEYAERWGERGDSIYRDFQNVSRELRAAKKELSDINIDPDRLFNRMGSFSKVMMIIASAIDGFAAGYNKTKPTLAPAIERAIDRDIKIQQQNFSNKLRQVELTAAERNQLWNMLNVAQKNQTEAAYRWSQVNLSVVAKKTQLLNSRKMIADSIFALNEKISSLKAEKKTVTKTEGTREVLGTVSGSKNVRFATPKTSASEKLNAEESKRLAAAYELDSVYERFMDVSKQFEQEGRWQGGLKAWVGGGETRARMQNQVQDIVQKVKELSGVAVRPEEFKRVQKGFDTTFRTKAGAREIVRGFTQRTRANLIARARYHDARGHYATAQQYRDLATRVARRYNRDAKMWGYKPLKVQ